jgi:hypothetical protein
MSHLSDLPEMSEFVLKKSLLRSLVCGESDISDNSDIEFVAIKFVAKVIHKLSTPVHKSCG